ncbi:hypothetical protein BH23CHL2_BH23CHL2_13080 [soil metagenome]
MQQARSPAHVLAALLLLAGLVGACSRGGDDDGNAADDISVEISVTPEPPQIGPAVVEVTLTGPDGEPINDADVEIEGNMSHAGMEPVIVDAEDGQNGRYLSQGFEFTMGGDWIITVSGTLPDGREFDRSFDLAGVAS